MRIQVNGESRDVDPGTTIAGLLSQLKLDARFLAVERNRELVPRSQHAGTVLLENDSVEIVTLVGGG